MILVSSREFDKSFVSKIIKEQNLHPSPVPDYQSRPHYWQETARWRRVVEDYKWGAVLFLSDRTRGVHSTIVVIGRMLDLKAGVVGVRQKREKIHLSWYAELGKGLADAKSPTQFNIPPCLGLHEEDHVCDGGTNNKTGLTEPACEWRSRCIALQAFCLEQGKTSDEVIGRKSPEQIVQITGKLERRKLPSSAQVKVPPLPSYPANGTPVTYNITQMHAQIVASLASSVRDVASRIARECGLALADSRELARGGDLFVADRTKNTDYVTIYRASSVIRPIPLASWRLRVRKRCFRVQFPLQPGDPLFDGIASGDVTPWNDGPFQTVVNDVSPDTLRCEHVIRITKELISRCESKI